mgnify:CR=1 FL=1
MLVDVARELGNIASGGELALPGETVWIQEVAVGHAEGAGPEIHLLCKTSNASCHVPGQGYGGIVCASHQILRVCLLNPELLRDRRAREHGQMSHFRFQRLFLLFKKEELLQKHQY